MAKQKYTNIHNLSLLMSVWLSHDTYGFTPSTKRISTTTLLKSPRQIILGSRLTGSDLTEDVSGLINARLGQSIHAGVEAAWQSPQESLLALGYPQKVVDKIIVNPTEWTEDDLPVWIEIRSEKQLGEWTISGEADAILDGAVHDIKSTGIFAYTTGSNNEKYRLQMSIYRWLNQDKVTKDMGYIEYYFKDWDKLESTYKTNYPPFPIYQQPIPLLPINKTEQYIKDKITTLEKYWDEPETTLPLCSSEDLWQAKPQWQYFGKADAKRASKNFSTEPEAIQWRNAKGKGEVRYKPGYVKACSYCKASSVCSQYTNLTQQGLIK